MDLVPALRDYRVVQNPQGVTLLHTILVLADGTKTDLYLRRYKSRWDAAVDGGRVYAFMRKNLDYKKECEIEMFRRQHGFEDYWGPWVWEQGRDSCAPDRLELPTASPLPQGFQCQNLT